MSRPVCLCCRPGHGGFGLISGLITAVGAAAVTTVLPAWLFVSGRVLWRAAGPWDARWSSWAPDPPELAWLLPDVPRPPRTTWARRPGWHRQVVRFAALAVGGAALVAPVLTLAVLVGAVLGITTTALCRRIDLAPPEPYRPAEHLDPRWAPRVLPAAREPEPVLSQIENGADL